MPQDMDPLQGSWSSESPATGSAREILQRVTPCRIVSFDSLPPSDIICFAQKNLSNVLDTCSLKEHYGSEVSLGDSRFSVHLRFL
jgi:hypothetical protein